MRNLRLISSKDLFFYRENHDFGKKKEIEDRFEVVTFFFRETTMILGKK